MLEVKNGTGKAELGEGVYATCRIPAQAPAPAFTEEPQSKTDLSAMTAMLAAKWKQGAASGAPAAPEQARAGQVRSFRITHLDPEKKRIEVELAE